MYRFVTDLVGNPKDSFYAPNFEKVGSILVSACAFVRLFVRSSGQNRIQARVLKFHIWNPHQKIAYPYFFSCPNLSPLAELCPFEGLKVQICNHDISKTITARSFKLGQLIEDDE